MARTVFPQRNAPIDPSATALLLIDVQKGIYFPGAAAARPWFHQSAAQRAIPAMARLLTAARGAGSETIYTVIQSLTRDGRDRSQDYKQTGFHFPPGSIEAEVCDEVAPETDELVLAKSSSSLFNSTVFEYLLRNMGLDTVIVTGFLTDQCVDHTIRDGADRGFRMICAADACTTDSQVRHDNALAAFKGYCRVATSAELVAELGVERVPSPEAPSTIGAPHTPRDR